MSKYEYLFSCSDCENMKYVNDSIRNGMYCTLLMVGNNPIHADDDYKVRCNCYRARQATFFDLMV